MLKIKLDTIEKCEKLVQICKKYQDVTIVDIYYGHYVVDGCSFLGVMSLLLHEVEINVVESKRVTDDIHPIKEMMTEELKNIGAWRE